jgi:dethiobiotin synthetase
MKPAQTGVALGSGDKLVGDALYLATASGVDDAAELICPIDLREPLAPAVAAKLDGVSVDVERIADAYRVLSTIHDLTLVEGAGGLAVPLADGVLMSDLAIRLSLPVLIVARPGLGTINHCVLTVRYAQSCGLSVLGIVISNWPERPDLAARTSPVEIERYCGVPILGTVPHDSEVDTDLGRAGSTIKTMADNPLVEQLLAAIAA